MMRKLTVLAMTTVLMLSMNAAAQEPVESKTLPVEQITVTPVQLQKQVDDNVKDSIKQYLHQSKVELTELMKQQLADTMHATIANVKNLL